MQRTFRVVVIAMLAIVAVAWAEDGQFKNSAAESARKEFDRAIDTARKAYERTASLALTRYVSALRLAQVDATKRGDLESAVEVRDAIASLEATGAPGPDAPRPTGRKGLDIAKALIGTEWVRAEPDPANYTMSFPNATDVLGRNNFKGTWKVINDDTVIITWEAHYTATFSGDLKTAALYGKTIEWPMKRSK